MNPDGSLRKRCGSATGSKSLNLAIAPHGAGTAGVFSGGAALEAIIVVEDARCLRGGGVISKCMRASGYNFAWLWTGFHSWMSFSAGDLADLIRFHRA